MGKERERKSTSTEYFKLSELLGNSDSCPAWVAGCPETHCLSLGCDCGTKPPHGGRAFPSSSTSNYHLRTPLMPPGATPQLLMTTMGPSRLYRASVGPSLWEHQLCAVSHPSKHHCRAASPSACSPSAACKDPLSQLVAPSLVQEQSVLVKSLELSNDLSNDVDNISLSHSKA